MEQQKQLHQNAYAKWSDEEGTLLKQQFSKQLSIKEMAALHERNQGAIKARLKKLGLLNT